MSFTAKLKEEVLEKGVNKNCCETAFLAGMVAFSSICKGSYLRITLENRQVARKIIKLLKKVVNIQAGIEVKMSSGRKPIYVITISEYLHLLRKLKLTDGEVFSVERYENICCKKAFIKGAFLGGGSVADPQKRYHLEFVSSYGAIASKFADIFSEFDLRAGCVERRGKYVVYFKGFDAVCNVLTIAEATSGVLKIYEVKVIKDKKNEVNRLNNSEIANIIKVADASATQRSAIKKIEEYAGLDSLPDTLRDLAIVRLQYPDDGLAELGKRLSPPIGKSGVNHRMRKIIEISKRY